MKDMLRRFDTICIRYVAMLPRLLTPAMTAISVLGQPPVIVGVSIVLAIIGLVIHQLPWIIFAIVAVVTLMISTLLKVLLRRKRPMTEYVARMKFYSFSFPSGHSSGAAVAYGAVAVCVAMIAPSLVVVAGMFAVVLTFLIGLSRIYLGAHFPTDVLAGWLFGIIGLIIGMELIGI